MEQLRLSRVQVPQLFKKTYKLKLYGFILMDIPGGSEGKASACNAGDPGSIPEDHLFANSEGPLTLISASTGKREPNFVMSKSLPKTIS